MSTSSSSTAPTAAEAMLFFFILKNLRNKADIDWDAVALDSRLKNASTAKARFGQIKKKLGISSEPSPSPKKVGQASTATPTKVTKKGGRIGAKARSQPPTPTGPIVKQEPQEEEDTATDGSPSFPSPPPVKREEAEAKLLSRKGFDALMGDGCPF